MVVKLVANNHMETSILELALVAYNVTYDKIVENKYKLETPYLIVDGIPLDMERSLKWIKEYIGNE